MAACDGAVAAEGLTTSPSAEDIATRGVWYALDAKKENSFVNQTLDASVGQQLEGRLASSQPWLPGEALILGTTDGFRLEARAVSLQDLDVSVAALYQAESALVLQWWEEGVAARKPSDWRLLIRVPRGEQALGVLLSDPSWKDWWLDAVVKFSTNLVGPGGLARQISSAAISFNQQEWFALDVTKEARPINAALGPEEIHRMQERLGSQVPLHDGEVFPLSVVDGKLSEARVIRIGALQTEARLYRWQPGPEPCKGAYASAIYDDQLVLIQQWRELEPSQSRCNWRIIVHVSPAEDALGYLLTDPLWPGWWLDVVIPFSARIVTASNDPGDLTSSQKERALQLVQSSTPPLQWDGLMQDVLRLAEEQQAVQQELNNVCAGQTALQMMMQAQVADYSKLRDAVEGMQQTQASLSLELGRVRDGNTLALQGGGRSTGSSNNSELQTALTSSNALTSQLQILAQEQSDWHSLIRDLSSGQNALKGLLVAEAEARKAVEDNVAIEIGDLRSKWQSLSAATAARQQALPADSGGSSSSRAGTAPQSLEAMVRQSVGESINDVKEEIANGLRATLQAGAAEDLQELRSSLGSRLQGLEIALQELESSVKRREGEALTQSRESPVGAASAELELRLAQLEARLDAATQPRSIEALTDPATLALEGQRQKIDTMLMDIESRISEVDRSANLRPSLLGGELQSLRQEMLKSFEQRYEEMSNAVGHIKHEFAKEVSQIQATADAQAAHMLQRLEGEVALLRQQMQEVQRKPAMLTTSPQTTPQREIVRRSVVEVDGHDEFVHVTSSHSHGTLERVRDVEISLRELQAELATEVAQLWKAIPRKEEHSVPGLELALEASRGQVLREARSLVDSSITEMETRLLQEMASFRNSSSGSRHRTSYVESTEVDVSITSRDETIVTESKPSSALLVEQLQLQVSLLSSSLDELTGQVRSQAPPSSAQIAQTCQEVIAQMMPRYLLPLEDELKKLADRWSTDVLQLHAAPEVTPDHIDITVQRRTREHVQELTSQMQSELLATLDLRLSERVAGVEQQFRSVQQAPSPASPGRIAAEVQTGMRAQLVQLRLECEDMVEGRLAQLQSSVDASLGQFRREQQQHQVAAQESMESRMKASPSALSELRSQLLLFEEQWQAELSRVRAESEEASKRRHLALQADMDAKLNSPGRRSVAIEAPAISTAASDLRLKAVEDKILELQSTVSAIDAQKRPVDISLVLESTALRDQLEALVASRCSSMLADLRLQHESRTAEAVNLMRQASDESAQGLQASVVALEQRVLANIEELRDAHRLEIESSRLRIDEVVRMKSAASSAVGQVVVPQVPVVEVGSPMAGGRGSLATQERLAQSVVVAPAAEVELQEQLKRSMERCTEVMQSVEEVRKSFGKESERAQQDADIKGLVANLKKDIAAEISRLSQNLGEELEVGLRGIETKVKAEYRSLGSPSSSSKRGNSSSNDQLRRELENSLRSSLQEWARTNLVVGSDGPRSARGSASDAGNAAISSATARAIEAKFMKELIQMSKDHQEGQLQLRDLIVDTASRQQASFEDALDHLQEDILSQVMSSAQSELQASPIRPRIDFGVAGTPAPGPVSSTHLPQADLWGEFAEATIRGVPRLPGTVPAPNTDDSPRVSTSWQQRRSFVHSSVDDLEAERQSGSRPPRIGASPAVSSNSGAGTTTVVREWIPARLGSISASGQAGGMANPDSLRPVVAEMVATELRRSPDLAGEALGALDRAWREELEQMCTALHSEQLALNDHLSDVQANADSYLQRLRIELEDKMFTRLQVSVEELYDALREDVQRLLKHEVQESNTAIAHHRGRR